MNRAFRSLPSLLLLLLCAGALSAVMDEFPQALRKRIAERWGGDAVERLQRWRATEIAAYARRPKIKSALSEEELQFFNRFWNAVPYHSDQKHWGREDYWATPVEMLASNGADCEDYSIAKYFSLKRMGVPPENLRITYVRSLRNDEAHMVLAYYPFPGADPYILDNLDDKVERASMRVDLEPVYSFNDDDLWAAGTASFKGKSSQIRLWSDLLDRMKKERRK